MTGIIARAGLSLRSHLGHDGEAGNRGSEFHDDGRDGHAEPALRPMRQIGPEPA